jgi:hypothetical protein
VPRRPSVDVIERDAQAADLYRRGLTYRQIAGQMGYRSHVSAGNAIRRHATASARDSLAGAEALTMMLDRLQDYRRAAYRVLTAKHYTVSNGRLIVHPETKEPLLDDGPVLTALDRLLRFDQEEAKLRDLYPAAKTKIEFVPEESVDAEIEQLTAEMAERDRSDPGVAGEAAPSR